MPSWGLALSHEDTHLQPDCNLHEATPVGLSALGQWVGIADGQAGGPGEERRYTSWHGLGYGAAGRRSSSFALD